MIKLTPEARKFILLQRTQLKPDVTDEEIEADFRGDFETYESYLPKECKSVVDIGSGIGVQDIFLTEKYENISIVLIDKEKTDDDIWYGFKEKAAFYNSLELASKTIMDNGSQSFAVVTQPATDDFKIEIGDNKIDLVTSFIAWGFHFPIDTYLDEVIRVMRPGARLIVDVRKDTDGFQKLAEHFVMSPIKEFAKYTRWLCKKGDK